jgi:large subunit ribosomal protein L32
MAVPKKKTSKARSKQRRAHDALPIMAAGTCKKCGEKKRPHHVCPACGNYDGKQVVVK